MPQALFRSSTAFLICMHGTVRKVCEWGGGVKGAVQVFNSLLDQYTGE